MAYQNNPNFTNFFKQHRLKFHAYVDYKKADIAERSALYAELAKKIWAADLSVATASLMTKSAIYGRISLSFPKETR